MTERSNSDCRLEAAFVTPTGEEGMSQPAVRVERSMSAKDWVPLAAAARPAADLPRRMA